MKLYLIVVTATIAVLLWVAPSKSERLTPRIDRGTGCHYLVTNDGGVVPRMMGNGKQMGCRDE